MIKTDKKYKNIYIYIFTYKQSDIHKYVYPYVIIF